LILPPEASPNRNIFDRAKTCSRRKSFPGESNRRLQGLSPVAGQDGDQQLIKYSTSVLPHEWI
jgi:hypothetical protein